MSLAAERHGQSRKRGAEENPKRQNADRERELEQEQEQQVEAEQEQQRDALQDQLGNQGVASMLGLPSIKPGQAGLASDGTQNRDQRTDLQFGGDDDLPTDGPLTLEDLVRSWNPTTRRGQDAIPGEVDPTSLPPEDEELRALVVADPAAEGFPSTLEPDPLLQPTVLAVVDDLGPVVRLAARCASARPAHRAWVELLSPAAAVLADPDGRTLFTRARVAALANLLLVDGGLLDGPSGLRRAPMASTLSEIAARSRAIDAAAEVARAGESRLPQAADLLTTLLEGRREGRVEVGELPPGVLAHLTAVIADLTQLGSAASLIPSLAEPEVVIDEGDDPLGLDDILAASTGGRPDPLAGVYDAALAAAEKLAAACAGLRVRAAGAIAAVGSVCEPWSSGTPLHQLRAVATALDAEVMKVLQLLVEIGRAAQKRSVPPPGIRNGLRRAARTLDQIAMGLAAEIAPVLAGVVTPGPDWPPPPLAAPPDRLAEARGEGRLADAVAVFDGAPPGFERDVARAFARAAAGGRRGLGVELFLLAQRADAEGRSALAAAVSLIAGAAALHDGAYDAAATLAADLGARGRARRNGLLVANATLLAVEVHRRSGDPARAAHERFVGARTCYRMGSAAGFTLVLRWTPPEA